MAGVRSVGTIQSSNAEKQKSLAKKDWLMKMVKNVTAGVTRIFSYELKCIERKEQLKIKDVNTIVFNHLRFDESLSS